MALQGTLETFSVPEVLRLLSGTNKTGLLALEGDRGAGNVWLVEGRIVDAVSDHEQGDKLEAVLFDLLRFGTGSFVFDSDGRADEPTAHDVDVDAVLGEAERLLGEWREIESVVPSLDVRVHLVDELSGESVTVTADQWRSVALVGSGISARRLGAHLDLGEFDACSLVRDLVEAGLVEVSEDAVPVAEPDVVVDAPTAEGVVEHDLSQDEVASLSANLADFVARPNEDEPAHVGAHEDDEIVDVDATDARDDDEFGSDSDADDEAESGVESDEFLSQLANFSPKAAAALEATSEAATDDATEDPESQPKPDLGADGDEEINRNLLLKFLSSAKN